MIKINTLGSNTVVDFILGVPSLNQFKEPTRSILQKAFDVGSYEVLPDVEPAPIPVTVREIDARRLRLALNQMELLTTVEAAIDRSDKATQIEWEYADRVKEDYPLVQSLIAILKLTPEQVDRVFEIGLGFI